MKNNVLMLLPNGFDPDPRVHNEAKALVEAGYHVTIICWDREGKYVEEEEVDGIHIERIHVQSSYGRGTSQITFIVKFWWEAFKRALEMKSDVIHAHDFNVLPLAYVLGRKLRLPVIYDAHESYHEMLDDNVHRSIKWLIAKTERFFIKRIDLLITVGSILEDEYKSRGAANTTVVGNWKLPEDFQFSNNVLEEIKCELSLPDDKLIISYIGYLLPSRGLIPLIDAVKEREDVVLILGGKGQMAEEIELMVANCDSIRFLGFTKPKKIPLITAASDVVYYGIQDSSGNNRYSAPNKLFEGLAAGCAIITGDMGEIGKIVKEEDCGIVLSSIDTESVSRALDMLTDKEIISKKKINSKSAGDDTYNWKFAASHLQKIYSSLLDD